MTRHEEKAKDIRKKLVNWHDEIKHAEFGECHVCYKNEKVITKALLEVEEAERERCVKVAETLFNDCSNGTPSTPGKHRVAMEIAQEIRNLTNSKGEDV